MLVAILGIAIPVGGAGVSAYMVLRERIRGLEVAHAGTVATVTTQGELIQTLAHGLGDARVELGRNTEAVEGLSRRIDDLLSRLGTSDGRRGRA